MDRRVVFIGSAFLFLCDASSARADWQLDGSPLCTALDDQQSAVSVADGFGGAIVVWRDRRGGADGDLYAQRIDASGATRWEPNGVPVCNEASEQRDFAIAADERGGVLVAWVDDRGGIADVFAQRLDPTGARRWTAAGAPVCTAPGAQTAPRVVADGAGGAIIAWIDARGEANDVFTQHVDSTGAAAWSPDGVPVCTAPQDQSAVSLVSNGSGGAVLAWQDARAGLYHIYAQRVESDGSIPWALDGVAVCLARNGQYNPTLASDAHGGAVVVWTDYRSFNGDIFAQRVDSAGTPRWTEDGVALCAAIGSEFDPEMVSDGAGGAIVAWQDFRDPSTDFDVYAQRVDDTGQVRWTPDGVALCTAAQGKGFLALAADGEGGAIVAWHDYRNGNPDIYGQRVSAEGAPRWISNGVAFCRDPGGQLFPAIVGDGQGGAVVAWQDLRHSEGSDIYAQRLLSSGSFPNAGVESGARATFDLSPVIPNPTRGSASVWLGLTGARVVNAEVLDLSGRVVAVLAEGRRLGPGPHRLTWNTREPSRAGRAAGIYFLRVRIAGRSESRKIVITN